MKHAYSETKDNKQLYLWIVVKRFLVSKKWGDEHKTTINHPKKTNSTILETIT